MALVTALSCLWSVVRVHFSLQKQLLNACTPACTLTFTNKLKPNIGAASQGFFEVAPGHQTKKRPSCDGPFAFLKSTFKFTTSP
jgi:hypothetical protein